MTIASALDMSIQIEPTTVRHAPTSRESPDDAVRRSRTLSNAARQRAMLPEAGPGRVRPEGMRLGVLAVAATADYISSPMGTRQTHNVQRHRVRPREQGLRPVQLWLPDTSTPAFKAQAARAMAAVARLSPEDEAMVEAFERIAGEDLNEWS